MGIFELFTFNFCQVLILASSIAIDDSDPNHILCHEE